jgi:transcriptional regulator GlxA family with amidase domain
VVVGYDGAELLEIASVVSTLATANDLLRGRDPYDTVLATLGGGPLSSSSGLTLVAQAALEALRGPIDTLVVSGGWGHESAAAHPLLVAHLRRLARESRRVASVCTGSTLLAAAGLLDGRNATTHWHFTDWLATRYPRVTVCPDPVFVHDGPVSSSAGVTSALDLTLEFVEQDHGPELAAMVARILVVQRRRSGDQPQRSPSTAADPGHILVRRVLDHVHAHLAGDLGTASLARVAGVSERQLRRLCRAHTGLTPGQLVRRVRLETAADLLAATSLPVAEVASRCGFGSPETLRQLFADHYGTPPSRYRASRRAAGA